MIVRKKNNIYQVLNKKSNLFDYLREFIGLKNKKVVFESKDSFTSTQWASDNCSDGESIELQCTVIIPDNCVLEGKRKPQVTFLEN